MKNIPFLLGFFLICFTQNAFSQVSEDFSDGNFDNWVGNTDHFTIDNEELRLDAPAAGTSYLSHPVNISGETNWNFYTRIGFAPSNNNQLRFYLSSDIDDLTGNLNGYCLLVGETNSNDVFRFIRVDNGVDTELGVFASLGAMGAASQALVKVTRNNAGNWIFSADFSGGICTTEELSLTDNTYPSGNYVGMHCKYTSGNITNFYFDDIYVNATSPTNSFGVQTATVISATEIELTFSIDVETTSASQASNYVLLDANENPVSTPATVMVDASDPTLVHLTFIDGLESGVNYTLEVTGVNDCSGSPIGMQNTASLIFFQTFSAGPFDILINEIMADINPLPPGDFDAKYIELYNRSDNAIQLENFTLSDAANSQPLPFYTLPSGGYVLIFDNGDEDEFTEFTNTITLTSFPVPNTSGDVINLLNQNGELIDEVDYDQNWYQPDNPEGGISLERINPNLYCAGAENWRACQDPNGGTPGSANSFLENSEDIMPPAISGIGVLDNNSVLLSFDEYLDDSALDPTLYSFDNGIGNPASVTFNEEQTGVILTVVSGFQNQTTYTLSITGNIEDCYGNALSTGQETFSFYNFKIAEQFDILINEIFADPDTDISPALPDAKFIELYNRSDFAIRLGELFLSDQTSETILPNYTLLPGAYVVICDDSDLDLFSNYNNTISVNSFPAPNGTGDVMTLLSEENGFIDEVAFTTAWYQDSDKDNGGWSLELINPERFCEGEANWRASVHPSGATPGSQNSVLNSEEDFTPPVILSVVPSGNRNLWVYFDEPLDEAAADPTNFSISPIVGNITNLALQPDRKSIYISIFVPGFQEGTEYTLSLNNPIADCYGNQLNSANINFTYYTIEEADRYDIIINEFFADPKVSLGLPEIEFIELYNRSNKTISLRDYTFTNKSLESSSENASTAFPFYRLRPGNYVVIHEASLTNPFSEAIPTLAVADMPGITNGGAELILKNRDGAIVNAALFLESLYNNPSEANGRTMELKNSSAPCEVLNGTNWVQSTALIGGTPGKVNSVDANSTDETLPDLIRAYPVTNTTIRLFFNKALDENFATDSSLYVIDNGIGQAIKAIAEEPFFHSVLLELPTPLQDATKYTVTIDGNMQDCLGNKIGMFDSYTFGLPQAYATEDIIINEILFNPETGGARFIELYNRSDKFLDLDSLNIRKGLEGSTGTVEIPYILAPDDYVVLTTDPIDINNRYTVDNIYKMIDFDVPSFDDRTDTVILYTSNAIVLDALLYDGAYHHALLDREDGVSLERINPEAPSNDRSNWHSASEKAGYATPTYQNSQHYVGNFPESNNFITIENITFSPDDDGFEDFLLINYQTDKPGYVVNAKIYDANGRLIREVVQNELLDIQAGNFKWDGDTDAGHKARFGIYIFYAEFIHPDGDAKVFKENCVVGGQF